MTLRVLLASLLALVLAAPAAAAKRPEDFASLLRTLPRNHGKRIERLDAFARDDRMRVSDRLRALREMRLHAQANAESMVAILLREAALFGVAHARRERGRAYRRALMLATEELKSSIQAAQAVDNDLRRLEEIVNSRVRRQDDSALSPDEAALQVGIQDGVATFDQLGDVFAATRARLALAMLKEATGAERSDVLASYTRLLRAGGNGRDTAGLRRDVRRGRSRVLLSMGRRREAVHESLIADRMRVVPPTRLAVEDIPRTLYDKSEQTEALCHEVLHFGVRCAEVQRSEMDDVVYYDYTRNAPRSALGEEHLARVLDEYGDLLDSCAKLLPDDRPLRVEWRVSEAGLASDIVLRPVSNPSVQSCVTTALTRFRYPRSRAGGAHAQTTLTRR